MRIIRTIIVKLLCPVHRSIHGAVHLGDYQLRLELLAEVKEQLTLVNTCFFLVLIIVFHLDGEANSAVLPGKVLINGLRPQEFDGCDPLITFIFGLWSKVEIPFVFLFVRFSRVPRRRRDRETVRIPRFHPRRHHRKY